MSDLVVELHTNVDQLEMSVRLANVMHVAATRLPDWAVARKLPAAQTIQDLLQWREEDLLQLPNMGQRVFRELRTVLASHGYSIKDLHCRKSGCSTAIEGLVDACDEHRCKTPECTNVATRTGHCTKHQPKFVRKRATDDPDFEKFDAVMIDAVRGIVRSLRPLHANAQRRALEAARILLGQKPETPGNG